MTTKTLWDDFSAFKKSVLENYKLPQARQIMSETESGIRRALEELGQFAPEGTGRKASQADIDAGREVMKRLPSRWITRLPGGFKRYCDRHGLSTATYKVYSGRLEQLKAFHRSHTSAWRLTQTEQFQDLCCPAFEYRGSPSVNMPLTNRRHAYQRYRLAEADMPSALLLERGDCRRFLTATHYPGRVCDSVAPSTADTYMKDIDLMLSFVCTYRGIDLSELRLTHLIPKISDEELEGLSSAQGKKFWRSHQKALEELIFDYFDFLKEENSSISPHTHIAKLVALQRLTEYIYREDVQRESDYLLIPIYNTIKDLSKQKQKVSQKWRRTRTTVADQSLKFPDPLPGKTALTTARELILSPVRQSCRYRTANRRFRSGWAIASSHQKYLKLAFVMDVPPRRQSEYRKIKVALSCPVEKPDGIPPGEYYSGPQKLDR